MCYVWFCCVFGVKSGKGRKVGQPARLGASKCAKQRTVAKEEARHVPRRSRRARRTGKTGIACVSPCFTYG